MHLEPIGTFHCPERHPYDAARQATVAADTAGHILLEGGHNYEQALQDLEGFARIWLIFGFHHNAHWKPLVRPPRAPKKMGVFATRAPYRPNALGLSCVALRSIEGRRIEVAEHDLLDGTPIYDIKPYLPYADSFPEAECGWVDALDLEAWQIEFAATAEQQLAWLEAAGVSALRGFLLQQLAANPFDEARKRVRPLADGAWEIAYRTWRIQWRPDTAARHISIETIASGYSESERLSQDDPYHDKAVHRAYVAQFPSGLLTDADKG